MGTHYSLVASFSSFCNKKQQATVFNAKKTMK